MYALYSQNDPAGAPQLSQELSVVFNLTESEQESLTKIITPEANAQPSEATITEFFALL